MCGTFQTLTDVESNQMMMIARCRTNDRRPWYAPRYRNRAQIYTQQRLCTQQLSNDDSQATSRKPTTPALFSLLGLVRLNARHY
jgi:hypothetical protein